MSLRKAEHPINMEAVHEKFPLHYCVWKNEHHSLEEMLNAGNYDIELMDPRGRTPLMLAVILGHMESARALLRHGANSNARNKQYWSVAQESICTGDPEMVRLLLRYRDSQRIQAQAKMVTDLLTKLKDTPDFYVEMKWEFTSWIPLVSRMCPSDVCRVWKSGPNVRIDTTLLGVTGASEWRRGSLSYIFRATGTGARMEEVNAEDRTIYRHEIGLLQGGAGETLLGMDPSEDFVARKLTQPIFVTYVDTEKIEFERSKAGILGWRSDRKENINGRECHVYSASNVQLVTLRRTEHLTEAEKQQLKEKESGMFNKSGNPISALLGAAETEDHHDANTPLTATVEHNPCHIRPEEYFDARHHLTHGDIGRPKQMTSKIKTFKAHLWLSNDFPLSLQDQVLPIIDLMAEYNPHFNKLKDFVTMQLPAGFPMKIEIPLYHILNARITFGNINASDTPVSGVTCLRGDEHAADKNKIHCTIDESVFDLPLGYSVVVETSPGHGGGLDEEEQLLQMALQQSLIEYGAPEANAKLSRHDSTHVTRLPPSLYAEEEALMQAAIARSLSLDEGGDNPPSDLDIAKALEVSRKDQEENERRRKEEEEELKRILELSLLEK